jgi:hypothetical protein
MAYRHRVLMSVVVLWACFNAPVAAYIDPGTGTALVQTLLAGLVALSLALRRHVHSFWRRFRSGKSDIAGG